MRIVVANWKRNMDTEKVRVWLSMWEQVAGVQAVIAPSLEHLPLVRESNPDLTLATQDASEVQSAGEAERVPPHEVVKFSLTGHSERHETIGVSASKTKWCLEQKVTPILCFADAEALPKLLTELANNGVIPHDCIFCWEDPKNISRQGIYNPKTPQEIAIGVDTLKEKLSPGIKLLYGGSVNETNTTELANITKLDGALVGNASLNPQTFHKVVKSFA